MTFRIAVLTSATILAAGALWIGSAVAAPLPANTSNAKTSLPAVMRGEALSEETEGGVNLAPALQRQVVAYSTSAMPGTVVIDTAQTYLYYVLAGGKAIRYGIGVGRDGFTWSGTQAVTRKAEWPDWTPPAEMIARQPYLPRWMAGGKGNPLGARAMYLGNTVYRIHGTNAPRTIGHKVSSGCIRMLNADVIDLYSRIAIGTKIVVLPNNGVARVAAPTSAVSMRLAPRS
jgi:lipoprotein-anchoring transpeptidase ErfK/SrfK